VFLKKYGVGVKFVTSNDPSAFAAAIDENTKAIYVESIGNPKYNVSPIHEIAKVRRHAYAFVPVSALRWDAGCACA
jgi:O-acetylhomoserine/O-acetylserine sulfhydrylase